VAQGSGVEVQIPEPEGYEHDEKNLLVRYL